jgi:hypothetical protein
MRVPCTHDVPETTTHNFFYVFNCRRDLWAYVLQSYVGGVNHDIKTILWYIISVSEFRSN